MVLAIELNKPVSYDLQNLLSMAYENAVGVRRSNWRISSISSIMQIAGESTELINLTYLISASLSLSKCNYLYLFTLIFSHLLPLSLNNIIEMPTPDFLVWGIFY